MRFAGDAMMKRFALAALTALLFILLAAGCAFGEGTGVGKTQPCVRITAEGGAPIVSREEYVPATVEVFNCAEDYALSAEAEVKVRGNSTANDENEKPYRIRFREKQNMLGLHEGRKYRSWVLLRSYWNLAPDYMAFRLAKTIFEGRYYASDCMYVNLYVNGEYKGIYVLCEQNQAAKGRIEVYEPKEGETRADVGYLVEMDNYPGEHPYFSIAGLPDVTDILGEKRFTREKSYSIKSNIRSEEQKAYIEKYIRNVFLILYEASVHDGAMVLDGSLNRVSAVEDYDSPYEAVCAVIDADSLANMLILEEICQNYDVGEGSFYMAVDFSENSIYPKLTFLGPWDFNWAYYEPADGGYYASTFQTPNMGDRSNIWFVLAMRMEEFRELVKEKWRKLTGSGVLEETVDEVVADCEKLRDDFGPEHSWRIDMAKNIAEFVRGRICWLNGVWAQ